MRYFYLLILLVLICGCASREFAKTGSVGDRDISIGMVVPILEVPGKDGFCGSSTYGYCQVDSDCIGGGCSFRICQAKNEMVIITECEDKDCYDAKRYNLSCQCLNYKCQWTQ